MTVETDKDKLTSPEDEKKPSLIRRILAEIKKLIQELKQKEDPEKRRRLNSLQTEKDNLTSRFYFSPNFGKQVLQERQRLKHELEEKLKAFSNSSEDDKEEKAKDFKRAFIKVEKAAREIWEAEPKNLESDFKEVAQIELEEMLKQEKEKYLVFLKEKKLLDLLNEDKNSSKPKTGNSNPSGDEAKKAILQQIETLLKVDPKNEVAKQIKEEILSNNLSPLEINRLQNQMMAEKETERLVKDEKYRNQKFEAILSKFGINKDRQFREVDIYTQSEWMNFQYSLLKEKDILKQYQLKFAFNEQVHNLDLWLGTHASIDDAPKIMTQFKSSMLDEAVRERGATVAFRAYEQAFSRLAMTEGYLPATKIGWDPDDKTIWVNNWVKEQVKGSLLLSLKQAGLSEEEAQARYKKEYAPYEQALIRTGYKIFVFTLRGDEIQGELSKARKFSEVAAPFHEDLHRRLDPLSLPLRYWGGKLGIDEFLDKGKSEQLTKLYYFYSKGIEKKFETFGDWQKAIKELEDKGEGQFNIFDIGGILSVSDWRGEGAMKHIPSVLTPFLGIEMSKKKWAGDEGFKKRGYENISFAAKRTSLAWALKRNPLAIFRLAGEKDQQDILEAMGFHSKKEFFDQKGEKGFDNYDCLTQALQALVSRQEDEIESILAIKDEREKQAAAKSFFDREKNKGLNFDFVEDETQKQKLIEFVNQIQKHFGTPEMDGAYIKKDGRRSDNFEKLAAKREAFSLGTEDAMLKLLRFSELGDIALQRRFRDLGAESEAVEAFWNFTNNLGMILQDDKEIIKNLKAIHDALDKYQSTDTAKYMLTLADRVIDLTQEDKTQKWLPWPACELRDKWGGLTSKAEHFFGKNHLSKNKQELVFLVEDMIGAGFFQGMGTKEARKYFYKKYKLGRGWVLLENFWRYIFAVAGGLVIAGGMEVVKEVQKGVEESSKSS